LSLTAGVSSDRIRVGEFVQRDVSPKLGVVWSVLPSTVLRAAALESVRHPFVANQSVEPTQVAGFRQVSDDPTATRSRLVGLGLDQRLAKDAYAGMEVSRRRLSIPGIPTDLRFPRKELFARGYLYWKGLPNAGCCGVAVAIDPEYQRHKRTPQSMGPEGILGLRTTILTLGVRVFGRAGVSARVTGTCVRQQGELWSYPTPENVRQRFCVADAALDYRLPADRGVVTLGAKNLFDRHFTFIETDLLNPRFAAERFVYLKLLLRFR
jgi:hypothetical protein